MLHAIITLCQTLTKTSFGSFTVLFFSTETFINIPSDRQVAWPALSIFLHIRYALMSSFWWILCCISSSVFFLHIVCTLMSSQILFLQFFLHHVRTYITVDPICPTLSRTPSRSLPFNFFTKTSIDFPFDMACQLNVFIYEMCCKYGFSDKHAALLQPFEIFSFQNRLRFI